jgi:5-methyltetrahydropteroyltriglutamate--homocysteine methyltransferase
MSNGNGKPARAEVVGSLLQSERLLQARRERQEGTLPAEELTKIEDQAVLDAIALQESVGLDVITDGEMRRPGWADTGRHLDGLEPRQAARSYPASARPPASGQQPGRGLFGPPLTVVGKISPKPGAEPVGAEYPFLVEHARSRTKYTMAAPSYHRRYWSDEVSTEAYGSCEDFLADVRDWLHERAAWLVSQGCTYIQLDAPNYGSLCDPVTRQFHAEHGHDLDKEIAFDGQLDSSVFEGLDVTGALHICRGNTPGGNWHSQGGYAAIAEQLFPHLDVDVVLLEYDSERAGDFGPLALVKPETVAVIGLLTTKDARVEPTEEVETRLAEAATVKPLAELALSTQCGFASAANAPMSEAEQRAKLELVATVAHRVWA